MTRKKIELKPKFEVDSDFIPTGCTILNLALSENPYGGWAKGSLVNIVGDSQAGKSFMAWESLAAVSNESSFKAYNLYYNDAEKALDFDIENLWGVKTLKRVKRGDGIDNIVLEEVLLYIKKLIQRKKAKPVIYVGDSLDNMKSREELAKKEDKIGERDYPDVPRKLSSQLGIIKELVEKTDSLIIIVSQTRRKIGVFFGESQYRTGGDALRFNSHHEIWLAKLAPIYVGKWEVYKGNWMRIKIKKNKLTGKESKIDIPILVESGIDDIWCNVRWNIVKGFWSCEKKLTNKKGLGKVNTKGDFINGTEEKIIRHIQNNNLEKELIELTASNWIRIEKSAELIRKKRYE